MVAYAISDDPIYGGEPGFGRIQIAIAAAGVGLALCGMLPIGAAARVLLVAASTLAMLAIAEVVGECVLGPRLRSIYRYDEKLIFSLIPDRTSIATRKDPNGKVAVTFHINSDGFRGPELRPPGSATRVVVYGDSFVQGDYSPEPETFVAQLARQLATGLGREVEVINAGVNGYGPDQVSLKMEQELPLLRPGLAIVAVYAGNDYSDLMRNKMYRLGSDGTLLPNRWKLHPDQRRRFDLGQRESILVRAWRLIEGSRSPPGAARVIDRPDFLLETADREYRSFVIDRNDVITNTRLDWYGADVSLAPQSDSARYKVALMAAVLRRIRDVAAANAVPLVFLFIPHPVDVTDHYDDWRFDRARYPLYDGRNQTLPLESAARSLGVPYLSLYDVFRAGDANGLYFHRGNDHWNASGQRLAAQTTATYLLSHHLLEVPSSTDQRVEGASHPTP
jgi:hypothetical protein